MKTADVLAFEGDLLKMTIDQTEETVFIYPVRKVFYNCYNKENFFSVWMERIRKLAKRWW